MKWIFAYSIIATTLLYILENVILPTYGVMLMIKVTLFLLLPLFIGWIWKVRVGVFGKWTKESWMYGIGFGIFSAFVIGATYFLLRGAIDWQAIHTSMEARHITETTFILVFLYIMLGNSLLEEYFFRGVVFRHLLGYSTSVAYIVSSLMFSLYHMTIFQSWFTGYILALALTGLFVGGLFFAWLYEKTQGVWGAWIFHIFADLAILAIGYKEFFL